MTRTKVAIIGPGTSSFTPPLRRQGDGRSLTSIRNNSASWRAVRQLEQGITAAGEAGTKTRTEPG
jgi:hypothetical protein